MRTSEGLGATLRPEDAHDEAPDAKASPRPVVLFPREHRRLEYLLFTKITCIGIEHGK
jgi:hypothetical protein